VRRATFVVVLFCLFAIGAAHAQDPVAPGSLLRIRQCTPQCAQASGALLGLSQDRSSVIVHLGEELGPQEVPFERIERMEVSRGRESDELGGALLGGIAVGAVTFWVLKGAGAPCDGDQGVFCGMSTGERIGSTLLATGIGAVVGVLAAPSRERWELISPSQLNPNAPSAFSLGVAVWF
jgi:hypothetical protein